MTLQTVFQILVLLYTVTNMASIGLELNLRETLKSLRSARLVVLTLLWGWVVGPAIALLLTKVLPLAEPHALGLLIFSLAPVAPMVSLLARRARSDMDFTAALIPLAMVATVVLLPLMAPWLMKGLTLNIWALAKPLLLLVLLPLVVCAAIKVYASPVAEKLSPVVKRLAGISTLLTLGFVVVFHFRDIVHTLGSYAIGAEVLFLLAIALVSYRLGFGLKQGQRSAMALAMATRNGAPMLAVFTAFPDQDPRMLVMILLSGPVPAIVAFPLAAFFASRAGKAGAMERCITMNRFHSLQDPLAPPVRGAAGDHAGRRPAGGLGGRHPGRPDDPAEHRLRAGGRPAPGGRPLRGHHPAGGLRPAGQLAPPGDEPRRLHGHPGRGRPGRLRRARGSAAHAVRPGAGRGLRAAVLRLLDLPAGVPRQLPLARRDGGLHHRARRRGVHQPGAEDPRRSPCGRRRVGPAGGGGAPQGDHGDLGEDRGLLRGGPGPDPLHSARQPLLGGDRGRAPS